ncbi:unnamed protein product [Caenorhabditis bovis]|uniref:Uncharacterized protein n=1 Tax=Caenorhabditis bovis TaxID=2654633 RepID=A0A8S1F2A6_9PELO|nr:unnamed protein product [Caenorhabditis bovis]
MKLIHIVLLIGLILPILSWEHVRLLEPRSRNLDVSEDAIYAYHPKKFERKYEQPPPKPPRTFEHNLNSTIRDHNNNYFRGYTRPPPPPRGGFANYEPTYQVSSSHWNDRSWNE